MIEHNIGDNTMTLHYDPRQLGASPATPEQAALNWIAQVGASVGETGAYVEDLADSLSDVDLAGARRVQMNLYMATQALINAGNELLNATDNLFGVTVHGVMREAFYGKRAAIRAKLAACGEVPL
jgi:hypothetical protein